MSEKFRLDRKIGFQNMFYTKCINVIIDSIGPSIFLRSICYQLGDNLESDEAEAYFSFYIPLLPLKIYKIEQL